MPPQPQSSALVGFEVCAHTCFGQRCFVVFLSLFVPSSFLLLLIPPHPYSSSSPPRPPPPLILLPPLPPLQTLSIICWDAWALGLKLFNGLAAQASFGVAYGPYSSFAQAFIPLLLWWAGKEKSGSQT